LESASSLGLDENYKKSCFEEAYELVNSDFNFYLQQFKVPNTNEFKIVVKDQSLLSIGKGLQFLF
jgi:hypothetical protein